jgi:hypothetical protein
MDDLVRDYLTYHGGLTVDEYIDKKKTDTTFEIDFFKEDVVSNFVEFLSLKRKREDYEARFFSVNKRPQQQKKEISEPSSIVSKNETFDLNIKHFIYAMLCADMPHLIKIGITDCPHQRLKQANSHNTYKPPSGYVYWQLIQVEDSLHYENMMKRKFDYCRRKNPNGNWSEFFELKTEDLVQAFSEIEGERIDVANFDKAAEKKEMVRVRKLLKDAIENKTACLYINNPKTPGSKCFERYEKYKTAATIDQVQVLGGSYEDIVYDYVAGFFKLGSFNAVTVSKTFEVLPSSQVPCSPAPLSVPISLLVAR